MKKLILFLSVSTSLLFAQGYKIGDDVKDFNLKNIDGTIVSLKNSKDAKGFIVIFTCNHCPFAKAYEQRIIDLDKKFRPLGFPVVAINSNDPAIVPDDSFDNMVKTAKEKAYPFPYLFDETQEVAKAFGATKTPHVYVLNKNKAKYTVSYIGAIDNNTDNPEKADKKYVEDAVNQLLAGQTVTVAETKAIGCGIKWKK
jgi:peroxiredoxin